MEKPLRKRSRDGCFTCRKRKKKCDESSFPRCRNCTANELPCTWPKHVLEAKKIRQKSGTTRKKRDLQNPENISLQKPDDAFWTASERSASPDIGPARSMTNSPQEYLRRRSSEPLNTGISAAAMDISGFIGVPPPPIPDISQPLAHTMAPQQINYDTQTPESETKMKNIILQRIAMQQDCVDEEEVHGPGPDAAVDRDLIRSYIAHQMDVGESLRRQR